MFHEKVEKPDMQQMMMTNPDMMQVGGRAVATGQQLMCTLHLTGPTCPGSSHAVHAAGRPGCGIRNRFQQSW